MPVKSLNKVTLIGNITRDPVVKYTPKNTSVCSFGIATNRSWVGADGQKQEDVEFHNLVAWGKLADLCGSMLHKGNKIYAEGRLQTRKWKAEDGAERRTTEIVLEDMIMLTSLGGQNEGTTGAEDESSAQGLPEEFDAQDVSDDVPF